MGTLVPASVPISIEHLLLESTAFRVTDLETNEYSVLFSAEICSFTREMLSKDGVSCRTYQIISLISTLATSPIVRLTLLFSKLELSLIHS